MRGCCAHNFKLTSSAEEFAEHCCSFLSFVFKWAARCFEASKRYAECDWPILG